MQTTTKLKTEWRVLFQADTPNDVILRSVLDRRCPGLAFADSASDPTQLLVRSHGGKAFASRGVSEAFLDEAVDRAAAIGWTALAETGIPTSVRGRGRAVERVRFEDCDLESDALKGLRDSTPPGFDPQALDRELLERCHHAKRELSAEYGERLDDYFAFGYGVCLLHRAEVVCEAYTGFVAGGRAEAIIGTVTAFRRRGLAAVAAAYLAEEARRRGHALVWNCHADNAGSIAVARRLAFRTETPYREIYF